MPGGRIAILDGAMGTMIQACGLEEEDFHSPLFPAPKVDLKGDNDCLNLSRPEIIAGIHRKYIDAGADIITSNTFSSNRISQKEYGLQDFAPIMAKEGAKIARKAADEEMAKTGRKILVAGSVGPTSKSLTLASDISDPGMREYSFDDFCLAYKEQIDALIEGGADLILLETSFDALNAKAAVYALEKGHRGFPLMVSVTCSDPSGRTLTGQTLEAFYLSIRHYPLTAFGINCSLGAGDMAPMVGEIASFSEVPLLCYPNAGLPNELGGYDEKPEEMAGHIVAMARKGLLNIVGGCCGTTPEHIRACADAVEQFPPRIPQPKYATLKVSGLEAVTVDAKRNNFTNIGERTNVAGSRKFARLISEGNYDAALQIAAQQIENGANIIDINMDDAMLDSEKEMRTFVRCIGNDPSVAKAALMIDSSHWETILAGLKNAQGKCIVNSINLKDGEEAFLRKALEIHDLGAAMVVMAFDETGQATSYERKISVCQRAYTLLTSHGIPPQDIIFDPNVLSIGTGMEEHANYAVDFIEAVRWIKAKLPGAYTSGGISNLSFAFRGNNAVREAMHSVFLYHAVAAGLDMGIVNPGMLRVYDEIDPGLLHCVEDVILNRDPGATERLITLAGELVAAQGTKEPQKPVTENVEGSVEERICESLVKGKSGCIEEAVLESLKELGSPVKVIEGPLMAGMEKVGELFSQGRMFLPQVVKSAKIMKDAVNALQPYMTDSQDGETSQKPVIVMATVKGDVHDIGKNITDIVLSCNGFEVVDLGVMVDKETILREALAHKAAIIGVSGLITPSLYQMEELCREMTARGLDLPLFVGGATTSAIHTALKLAPLYSHSFYCRDASTAAVMAKKCLIDRETFEREQRQAMEKLVSLHSSARLTQAQARKCVFEKDSFLKEGEYGFRDAEGVEIPLDALASLMDWDMFLVTWGVKSSPSDRRSAGLAGLVGEGKSLLEKWILHNEISVRYSARFFQANSQDDALILHDSGGGRHSLPMLRQERSSGNDKLLRSLSDYAPDTNSGLTAPIGIFALSVSLRKAQGCGCDQCREQYQSMMEHCVRVCVAEAASKWIDSQLTVPDGMKISKPAIGYASCPDHSLKRELLDLLHGSERLGISLTESCAMIPDASICGFIIVHPQAGYPEIHHISKEQYGSYASRRGFSEEEAHKFLGHLL